MTDERLGRIALNTVPYMTPTLYHRLVAAFGSAGGVLKQGKEGLRSVKDATDSLAESVAALDPEPVAERELAYAERIGARVVLLGEEGYPEPLTNIFSPPPVLSIIGDWTPGDAVSIAVVGTRSPTTYGKLMAEKLTAGLAEAGLTIVSGLARGVDGVAHRAALAAGGRTVAILGCGLNIYYPPEHRDLQKKIPSQGAVISQFSFTTDPGRTLFPLRNRTIAGLAIGTLIIEAPEKSGALITAYAALEENRDVFALPGPVNSKRSVGTNRLIQKGHARLVQIAGDVIDELPAYIRNTIKTRQLDLELPVEIALSNEEKSVMMNVDAIEKHIDALAMASGLPLPKVSAILLTLEIKGLVKQVAGKMFIRI